MPLFYVLTKIKAFGIPWTWKNKFREDLISRVQCGKKIREIRENFSRENFSL